MRYYDPTIGRFTQQDTHWNTANMIYGDNPQNINQREDALGLTTYTHVPQISAILQSGNLYVYCVNNPVSYNDTDGRFLGWAVGGVVGGICGAIGAAISGDNIWAGAASGAVSGVITGLAGDIILMTGGTGAIVVAAYVGSGIAGGLAGVGVKYAITGKTSTDEILTAVIIGAASGALGGLMEGSVKSLAQIAAQKGRTVMQQAYRELVKEVRNLSSSLMNEFLSTAVSWLAELNYHVTRKGLENMLFGR